MDNNNSIPYGTISWDNEDSFSLTNRQREAQRIPSARNPNPTGNNPNAVRYSLRGPQFPPPQQRLDGVGLSRNFDLANHRQGQQQTPLSNFQQPSTSSSSSSSDVQHERFFSLRPVLNTPLPHVQPTSQSLNSNSSSEGQTFNTSCTNSLPGSSSNDPGIASGSRFPNFSAPGVSNDNARNNNVAMPQGISDRRSPDSFCASRAKRKSSFAENEEGQDGPRTKHFLSEEKMAARMHKLRISSDHSYPVNIMQSFTDQFVVSQVAGSSKSQTDNDDDEIENSNESTRQRQYDLPVFVIPPQVKDALNESQGNSIIPEAIYRQLSNPCLAVVPWRGPDEKITFSTARKPDDQDKDESDISSSSSSSCVSLIMDPIPETEEFQDKGIHHVEIVGECSTFSLEDDDMEQ